MLTKHQVDRLIRPALAKLKPYEPVEPVEALSKRISISSDKIIKLDANENPYGCSPAVIKAFSKYQNFNSYPDPEQISLRQSISKYTGANFKNIMPGSGSDELIELILRLFLEPGDSVINCPPTFGMYKFCTQICAGTIINVPRKKDFSIDINAIEKSIKKNTKVVFLASPNNPTGNTVAIDDVEHLLRMNIIIVIDEAYAEFSNKSVIKLVKEHANLLVLRTFSKWAGLAGLRVGYGIFPENIVNNLMKIKQPYNVNIAAQIAAQASLEDIDYLNRTISYLKSERQRLFKLLGNIKWLKPCKSESNFLLCLVKKGSAKELYEKLKQNGIIVRYYNRDLKNYIRVSVGKPEHTDRLIHELNKY